MKNMFMFGLGLGVVAGAYLMKNCPVAKQAYDTAETNVKEKIEECQDAIARKKQQKAAAAMNQGI